MVRPGPELVATSGPRIAKAGARNAADTDAATGYGGHARPAEIAYFAPAVVAR